MNKYLIRWLGNYFSANDKDWRGKGIALLASMGDNQKGTLRAFLANVGGTLFQCMKQGFFLRKVMFASYYMEDIWFWKPTYLKYELWLLMGKILYFSCTIYYLGLHFQNCPLMFPCQQPSVSMSASRCTI